jgi:hypothetical protein
MQPVHERLHDFLVRTAPCRIEQRLRLRRGQPERLLAQHVLAGVERLERPRDVQVVG